MTNEEAIDILKFERGYFCDLKGCRELQAFTMAIASLKAWEKVKQEINDLFSEPPCYVPNYEDYNMFLKIIDRHLQEVVKE